MRKGGEGGWPGWQGAGSAHSVLNTGWEGGRGRGGEDLSKAPYLYLYPQMPMISRANYTYIPSIVPPPTHPREPAIPRSIPCPLPPHLQGDGVPPNEARDFCEWLFAGKAGSLGHLSYSVCALGDRCE